MATAVAAAWHADVRAREQVIRQALIDAAADLAESGEHVARDLETLATIVDRLLVGANHTPAEVQREFAEIAASLPSSRRAWLVAITLSGNALSFSWKAQPSATSGLPAVALQFRGWRIEGRVDVARLVHDALAHMPERGLAVAVQGPGLKRWMRVDPAAGEDQDTPDFAQAHRRTNVHTILGTFRIVAVPRPRFFSSYGLALTTLTAGGALVTSLLVALLLHSEQRSLRLARQRKQIARAMLDAIPTPISFLDEQGRYVEFNQALARLVGRTFGQLKQARVADIWGKEIWEQGIRPRFLRALAGEIVEHEFRHPGPDHRMHDWLGTFMPWRETHSGKVQGVIVITRDVTEQKRLEREREEHARRAAIARRWEDLGMLAGGIAHDLNNLLQVITGAIEEAHASSMAPKAKQRLDEAASAAGQAARLTRQLLIYAGRGGGERGCLHPRALLEHAARLVRMGAPEDICVEVEAPARLPLIEGDRAQLEQVLFNLGLNAVQAIAESGRGSRVRMWAEARTGEDVRPELWEAHELESPAQAVVFHVEDDGPGIPEEVRERIFTPFFTTRKEGTGLGLAVVFGSTRAHRGFVDCWSEKGKGTHFTIWLPALKEWGVHQPDVPRPVMTTEASCPRGRVLVVDDEPLVRRTTARMLARLGWDPLEAPDGIKAVEAVRKDPAIQAVVMDVRMPRLRGDQALPQIKALRPELPVVLVSAATSGSRAQNIHPDAWLDKPFSSEALHDVLTRLLTEDS